MKRRYFPIAKGAGSVTAFEDVPTCIHPDYPRGERDGWLPACEDSERVE